MTPRLVLLTGPAAGEVAEVLRMAAKSINLVSLAPGENVTVCQTPWWDEVRDYWAAPMHVWGYASTLPRTSEVPATEQRIRSLPGGEAWLVGMVLRPTILENCKTFTYGERLDWIADLQKAGRHLDEPVLPARLAILAPDPPALLVERVRAWGGDIWQCATSASGYQMLLTNGGIPHGGGQWLAETWPEAVRAALGEVASV